MAQTSVNLIFSQPVVILKCANGVVYVNLSFSGLNCRQYIAMVTKGTPCFLSFFYQDSSWLDLPCELMSREMSVVSWGAISTLHIYHSSTKRKKEGYPLDKWWQTPPAVPALTAYDLPVSLRSYWRNPNQLLHEEASGMSALPLTRRCCRCVVVEP